jgi:hypothetical protein
MKTLTIEERLAQTFGIASLGLGTVLVGAPGMKTG